MLAMNVGRATHPTPVKTKKAYCFTKKFLLLLVFGGQQSVAHAWSFYWFSFSVIQLFAFFLPVEVFFKLCQIYSWIRDAFHQHFEFEIYDYIFHISTNLRKIFQTTEKWKSIFGKTSRILVQTLPIFFFLMQFNGQIRLSITRLLIVNNIKKKIGRF